MSDRSSNSNRDGNPDNAGRRRSGGGSARGGRPQRSPGSRGGGGQRPQRGRGPSSAPPIDPARLAARDVLKAVRERDAYANLVLPGLLRDRKLDSRDAALATELAYGACRARGLLDAVVESGSGRTISEIDGGLLDILRLGAYQLLRTRVAPHAAVATSVDLTRAEFGSGKAGFVNAVLRRVSEKSAEEWVAELAPDAEKDPVGHLAFEHAHPRWIAQAFADALGADAGELAAVLEADDARPAVHLVARPGEISAEELALITGGEEGKYSPYAVYLDGGDPGKLDAVRDGLAGVQDEGSQLVARALTLAPLDGPDGGRWLDLCAGPGGKAALLGALAEIDAAQVDAVEPAAHRAELVRKTTKALPVTVHAVDGRDPGLDPGYDRVLVDAPCTGLGALRRRPEARWRRSPKDVAELVTLQKQLLASAIELVRPGGVVLYSTCSPHLSETSAVVADAVRRHGVEELDTRALVPDVPGVGDGTSVQLWPHRHGTDAMFLAALRKPS
ncbi:rRNA small subunit methyltransferase B [Rhodococcus sp. BP-252]|uniref:RsmB/NOP family class I SAM-dependent RNA methyltransferase n=1 Tax=unclassified Rhodococcus (in: high G+C Gram-positive bacteria) TaxID=192944 RepID=UPI001C9B7ED9|nr:rRNA small subunit methyltransferase B [Rhodococcus sp. BP-320]MBY6414937.1 rRNA small subunit methyltransferase B [Rhodococcus sp. BP-321]MBY6421359.1 rRNA small subunit methyltransferase B [Rhodococcus sp. BP-324]MBY6425755.1 rRNA small subunit methyltransferase B [Rhodococcus sp. BP-323]MBY6429833.1 rRNA small subunit methyltransferase B [Rhodococcus sp. BP-322]MBY6438938.1 rRNA small subunit methyltransferase B [Rhodococcus sp. BP-319]MBY6443900.1 rRNA small subunit methyltransferase B